MGRCVKRLLDAKDSQWNDFLKRMSKDKRDIYFTSQYHLLEKIGIHADAQMFVYEEDEKTGIYSFIKRPIRCMEYKENYFDIETVYGYGGPLINTEENGFKERFESAFLEYCKREKIVAEFIRFHPLIRNEKIFEKNIDVIHNRKTVFLDLCPDIEDIWMQQISTQNRNTIRKCIKNNLTVEVSDDYDSFRSIYNETMKKVNAGDFYLFSQEYFDLIKRGGFCVLLCVKSDGNIIAAAIFMGYGEYFHYHLSGSKREYLRLAPNNILLWEAIKYAKTHGYKKMHLGGGLVDSIDDNLFKFKSHFSKKHADFYIGKRVHNKEVYSALIQDWEKKNGRKAELFLQYRE